MAETTDVKGWDDQLKLAIRRLAAIRRRTLDLEKARFEAMAMARAHNSSWDRIEETWAAPVPAAERRYIDSLNREEASTDVELVMEKAAVMREESVDL